MRTDHRSAPHPIADTRGHVLKIPRFASLLARICPIPILLLGFLVYLRYRLDLLLAGYAVWALVWLKLNSGVIRKAEPLLLLTSLAFFGLAVVLDLPEDEVRLPGHHLWEDGSKFPGIIGWCVYFVRV